MTKRGERFLVAYCVASSTALAAVLLMGAARPSPTFDEITVHRINVVEPDGTLRLVVSDKAQLPGVIVKGKEQPKADRPQAGMLFYNDEGSENGGLIFGGRRNAKGEVVDAGGSLSFDKYGAKEVVQLAGVDDAENRFAGLAVSDTEQRRIWVGRQADGIASVSLMDAQGKRRIALEVAASGEPSLRFFDDKGQVIQTLAPVKN
jgi:hypothetical protein